MPCWPHWPPPPALADVDGWDFSGQNARSQALGSDYKNLVDSYNIWVNPALVVKHSNRVDINITDDGAPGPGVNVDDEGAGVYKTFGAHTVGAFLGRPSVSSLAIIAETPRNQFDLFYGWHGVVDVGARLNFQAVSQENTAAPHTILTPNVFRVTDTIRNTVNNTVNSSETSSNELNLAFGVADPAGHWDATLLWGTPSAQDKGDIANQTIDEILVPAGTVSQRDTVNVSQSTNTEDDGAQNLGLTGRLIDIGIPNSIITLGYQSQDYGYKNQTNETTRNITDVGIIGTITAANGDTDETDNFASTTAGTLESDRVDLFFTKNFNPMPSTLVLATLGLTSISAETRAVTIVTADNTVNNFTGVTVNNFGIGTETNTKIELSRNALPLILGFEGDVTSNWTLRAAVRKDLFVSTETVITTERWAIPDNAPAVAPNIQTYTTKDESTRIWDTDTTLTLGAGYKNGSLAIDAVVQKEFVTLGVDEGLIGRLSVTWNI